MRAIPVAKYIIRECEKEGEPITNLQLQKILYYIHYEFLTKHNRALFEDDFQAWKHGPVVMPVYHRYSFGVARPLHTDIDDDGSNYGLSEEEMYIIKRIMREKRTMDSWELVKTTHQKGKAWDIVYKGGEGFKGWIEKDLIASKAF